MDNDFVYKDMLDWIKENNKPRVLTKDDVVEYTGLSRTTVDKLLYGVKETGARARYYYGDVAERITRGNNDD